MHSMSDIFAPPGSIGRALAEGARDMEMELLRKLVWGAVHNAGRTARERLPRWAHVRDTMAVGSTTARQLCREHDMDPDEMLGGEVDE